MVAMIFLSLRDTNRSTPKRQCFHLSVIENEIFFHLLLISYCSYQVTIRIFSYNPSCCDMVNITKMLIKAFVTTISNLYFVFFFTVNVVFF